MQLSEIVTKADLLPMLEEMAELRKQVADLKQGLSVATTDFSASQAAQKLNCSVQTVRRYAKLSDTNPESRYALRYRRNTPNGKIVIPQDALQEFKQRTDSEVAA